MQCRFRRITFHHGGLSFAGLPVRHESEADDASVTSAASPSNLCHCDTKCRTEAIYSNTVGMYGPSKEMSRGDGWRHAQQKAIRLLEKDLFWLQLGSLVPLDAFDKYHYV
jgi:hypothetical protein